MCGPIQTQSLTPETESTVPPGSRVIFLPVILGEDGGGTGLLSAGPRQRLDQTTGPQGSERLELIRQRQARGIHASTPTLVPPATAQGKVLHGTLTLCPVCL